MSGRTAEKDALHAIWREAADKRIEAGIDWPGVVRDLFRSLDEADRRTEHVRQLHRQIGSSNALRSTCGKDGEPYPCETIRALDADQALPADGTEVRLRRGMPGTYEGQPAVVRHQSPSGHSNLPRLVWLECEVIWSHGTAAGFWAGRGEYVIPSGEGDD